MDEIKREANGRWLPGRSANPGGATSEGQQIIAKVRKLAGENSEEAIAMLVGIMRSARAPAQARVAAANSILDRCCGKPAQAVSVETTQKYAFELPAEAMSEAAWLAQSSKPP